METHFEITFPLILKHDDSFTIKFFIPMGDTLEFKKGIYYLCGDNGSGKTTFVNMIALIAGHIGKKAKNMGSIRFNGEAYNGEKFNYIRAAEIREKSFCIFPQKAFFLPISTRDNYIILNGTEKDKEVSFSSQEYPDFLSGGQQQKILMDIVLDEKKPVWFLDEPLTSMDSERRHYFWMVLEKAFSNGLCTLFFIDHWLDREIKKDKDFQYYGTLNVNTENRQQHKPPVLEAQEIEIYENSSPENFFKRQTRKIKRQASLKKILTKQ
ncbi:ATP-binding cassette domain-containing protein [Thermodesulfobacteriota bacterium]